MQRLGHWDLNHQRAVAIPSVKSPEGLGLRRARALHHQRGRRTHLHTLTLNKANTSRTVVSQAGFHNNNSSNGAAAASGGSPRINGVVNGRPQHPITIENHQPPPPPPPPPSGAHHSPPAASQLMTTLHTSSNDDHHHLDPKPRATTIATPTVIALIINDTESTHLQRTVAILGVIMAAILSAVGDQPPHHHKDSLFFSPKKPIHHHLNSSTSTSTNISSSHNNASTTASLAAELVAPGSSSSSQSQQQQQQQQQQAGSTVPSPSSSSSSSSSSLSHVPSVVGMVPAVSIDSLRRGRLVENGCVYRQTFVIRSYEVGFDRTASIETLANLFQETALNHVGMADFVGDGMGTTHAMMRSRLIWVVTKMHIEAVDYPVWGDVVEIDSWVSGSGKNGMRRDFLVRDYLTGHIRARATSHWAMMNQDTRRLSKMPDDVRAEISPYFIERSVMINNDNTQDESEVYTCQRITKLDNSAPYIRSGLAPRLHDMDMNQHVNHVKYISWVLESIPQSFLVAHELMGMTLEYRRECNHSDVLSSLASPDNPEDLAGHFVEELQAAAEHKVEVADLQRSAACINTILSASSSASTTNSSNGTVDHQMKVNKGKPPMIHFTHLLRLQDNTTEILRGRTSWRLKKPRSSSATHRHS